MSAYTKPKKMMIDLGRALSLPDLKTIRVLMAQTIRIP
jgi:hypothetical protein